MKSFTVYTVAERYAGLSVEAYLKQVLQLSGRRLQKLTRLKGIIVNGRPAYLQRKLQAADILRVLDAADVEVGVLPEPGTVDFLYEDNDMLVVNKPAHLLVHPAGRTESGTLANHLAYALQQRGKVATIRPLHRLDRDTSGCVIFAKSAQSQFLLEQQLREKALRRTYWALVKGMAVPSSGSIDAPIGPHPGYPNRRRIHEEGDPAISHYRTLRTFASTSLLELTLKTGRTHQIRLHLQYLGCPLLGDGMYGVRSPWISRQALHAAAVSFCRLDNGRQITVEAPLPADFSSAINHCAQ